MRPEVNGDLRLLELASGFTATNFQERSRFPVGWVKGFWQPCPADFVVRVGLQSYKSGKNLCIPGLRNWLMYEALKFVPKGLAARLAASVFRPEKNASY